MANNKVEKPAIVFVISGEELLNINRWLRKHNCRYLRKGKERSGKTGAVGGALTYSFTPNSIGMNISVRCSCGVTRDITDYEDW